MDRKRIVKTAAYVILIGATVVAAALILPAYVISGTVFDMPILVASYVISLCTLLLSPSLLLVQRITDRRIHSYKAFAFVAVVSIVVFALAMNLAHRDAHGVFHLHWWTGF